MEEVKELKSSNTVRVNIRVSQKIKSYFEQKSLDTGVAQSALMALALEEYIDQKKMLEFTSNVDGYMNKLDFLSKETR